MGRHHVAGRPERRRSQDWVDIIDFVTMWPDARRRIVRALGELTAETDP